MRSLSAETKYTLLPKMQFAMPTGSQMQSICSLSRHSPYTSKSNPGRLRASLTRPVLGSLLYAKTQFAMPTGSQMQSICSLSRHSPYTSKSNPGHLRASSTRPVLICMCMAHCFAQKKHLRDAGAFVMYVTRFELATFWSVARRSIQLSYTYIFLLFSQQQV